MLGPANVCAWNEKRDHLLSPDSSATYFGPILVCRCLYHCGASLVPAWLFKKALSAYGMVVAVVVVLMMIMMVVVVALANTSSSANTSREHPHHSC